MRGSFTNRRSGTKCLFFQILVIIVFITSFLYISFEHEKEKKDLLELVDNYDIDESYLRLLVNALKHKQASLQGALDLKINTEAQYLHKIQALTNEKNAMMMTASSSSSSSLNLNKIEKEEDLELEGVAIVCCLDGPGWLQNRYSMSVLNILEGLPKSWKVQLFHKGSAQSFKGIAKNHGLNRMINQDRIIVTELTGEWAKRSRSELFLSPYFWGQTLAKQVLMFGHGGVLCHNSPFTLENFTSYDLCASNDGGFVLLQKALVISWLKSIMPPGEEYLKKIHGPVPYMLGALRKLPNIKIASPDTVNNFVLNPKSSWSVDVFPLAISGTLAEFSPEARKAAIEKCPEIKMVFPSLDNPACFGASSTLDKEACIASLCVSSPKQGGC